MEKKEGAAAVRELDTLLSGVENETEIWECIDALLAYIVELEDTLEKEVNI